MVLDLTVCLDVIEGMHRLGAENDSQITFTAIGGTYNPNRSIWTSGRICAGIYGYA